LEPKLRRSCRWLLASGASLLLALVFVLSGFGYFFTSAAQQRNDIAMPVPGLPDMAGDQAAVYGGFLEDGVLTAARVEPAFAQVRSQLDAVRAHTLYVNEKRHVVEVNAQEEKHLIAWLSRRLENELVAPNLETKGYRLVGGRMLQACTAGPAAQFMYETEAGNRITLYIE
jgi:anti-sigma factor RsiW